MTVNLTTLQTKYSNMQHRRAFANALLIVTWRNHFKLISKKIKIHTLEFVHRTAVKPSGVLRVTFDRISVYIYFEGCVEKCVFSHKGGS